MTNPAVIATAVQFDKLEIGNYFDEIRKKDQYLKDNDIIVVTGYSDDGVQIFGAHTAALNAYDGCKVDLTISEGRQIKFEALWCEVVEGETIPWTFKADFNFETFDIIEDDGVFCRAMVFKLEDAAPSRAIPSVPKGAICIICDDAGRVAATGEGFTQKARFGTLEDQQRREAEEKAERAVIRAYAYSLAPAIDPHTCSDIVRKMCSQHGWSSKIIWVGYDEDPE